MRACVLARCSTAEPADAALPRVAFAAVCLASLIVSSGRFSTDTKMVDLEGCSGDRDAAAELGCFVRLASTEGTGGATFWSLRAEWSARRSVCDRLPFNLLSVSAAALCLLLVSACDATPDADIEVALIEASGISKMEGEVLGRMELTRGLRDPSEAFDPVRRREGAGMCVGFAVANALRLCWLVVNMEGARRLMLEVEVTSAGVELYMLATRGLGPNSPLADWEDEAALVRRDDGAEK